MNAKKCSTCAWDIVCRLKEKTGEWTKLACNIMYKPKENKNGKD